MTELNLSKGLEALYTFDAPDFDSQRNHMRDRSGHGHHAVASGGPTLGVESPVGEAASFDGSDDYFDTGDPLAAEEQTVFAVVNFDDLNDRVVAGTSRLSADGDDGYQIWAKGGTRLIFQIADGVDGSNTQASWSTDRTGEWLRLVGRWTGEEVQLIANGELKDSKPETTHTQADTNTKIGVRQGDDLNYKGDIAVFGRWSRSLTWSEIQEINRMTARRVSRL